MFGCERQKRKEVVWSAPAERSGDGALAGPSAGLKERRRRRFALSCSSRAFSLWTVLSHARSPSPQPSPQGEGEPFASATKDRNAANGSEQETILPLLGERVGVRGKRLNK